MSAFITPTALEEFAQYLRAEDRSSGTIENYLRHVRTFSKWLGERPAAGLQCSHNQLHAGQPKPISGCCGLRDMPGPASADSATDLSKTRTGADSGGISPSSGRRPKSGARTAGPSFRDNLRHRHSGVRGPVYNRRGSSHREGGGQFKGKNPYDSSPR